jgi:uncharacterized protein YkwD
VAWTAAVATLATAGAVALAPAAQTAVPTGPFTVDVGNREEVRAFYYRVHQASEGVPMGWTGDIGRCDAGTVSADYLAAVLARTNWFRAMAGVPSNVVFTEANNAKAQAAALMMTANKALDHQPPPTWACFTPAGLEGAQLSNLTLGSTGPQAVDNLVYDGEELGHRRNMLDPRIATMGAGSVPGGPTQSSSLAQFVLTPKLPTRPPVRDEFVAWPPKGFVPYQTTYPLWSFSFPDADFSAATVTMQRNGQPVAIKAHANATFSEPAMIWHVESVPQGSPWPRPVEDEVYTVTVGNVVVGGTARTFTYPVTVFDPAVADPARTPVVVTGPNAVPVDTDATYTVNAIPNATGYQWRTQKLTDLNLTDSSDGGLANFDAVVGRYQPVDTTVFASAPSGFRLTWSAGAGTQSLTLKRTVLVEPNSQLSFMSRLENIDELAARVQASTDGGATWRTIDEQIRNGRQGTFAARVVPLGSLARQKVQLRFALEYVGPGGTFTCCDPLGWYIDDIALTGATEAHPPVVSDVTESRTFTFRTAEQSDFDIDVRPVFFGSGPGAWSPPRRVSTRPPLITTEPRNARVQPGATATFSVSATGAAPLTFVWAWNGIDLEDGPGVQGSRTARLTLSDVQAPRAGGYTVRVGNGAGVTTSATAELVVAQPVIGPAIVTQPEDQTVVAGANVTFSAGASGTPPLQWAWTFNGTPLVDGPGVAGATTAVLTLTDVQRTRAGTYTARVTNAVGNATTRGAVLTVNEPVTLASALDITGVPLVTSGDADWRSQATVSRDNVDAAQAGRITDNQATHLDATVTGPATIAFWWKVESEQGFDFLSVSLDGTLQTRISGNVDWTQQTVTVPAGQHTIRWTYAKDATVATGRDTAWIDQVTVT